jgi:hypothetical protein
MRRKMAISNRKIIQNHTVQTTVVAQILHDIATNPSYQTKGCTISLPASDKATTARPLHLLVNTR